LARAGVPESAARDGCDPAVPAIRPQDGQLSAIFYTNATVMISWLRTVYCSSSGMRPVAALRRRRRPPRVPDRGPDMARACRCAIRGAASRGAAAAGPVPWRSRKCWPSGAFPRGRRSRRCRSARGAGRFSQEPDETGAGADGRGRGAGRGDGPPPGHGLPRRTPGAAW